MGKSRADAGISGDPDARRVRYPEEDKRGIVLKNGGFRSCCDLEKRFMRACNRMKCLGFPGRLSRLILGFVLSAALAFSGDAQIQQAWVAHYNNGLTNGTNQAVKMVLDSSGNIYVTGVSQNTNGSLGYVTIKYASSGTERWVARYDSTNFPFATPSGLVLDASNNAVVTGNAVTVKYDTNGNQLWTAPFEGTSIAMDPGGNAIVTGIASSFSTVKLNPAGSNLWQATYVDSIGPALSQIVLVDTDGNVYVTGSETYTCFSGGCYVQLLIIKYDQNGVQLWNAAYNPGGPVGTVSVGGAALDSADDLSLIVDFYGVSVPTALQYSSGGAFNWVSYLNQGGENPKFALAVDKQSNPVVTGEVPYGFNGNLEYYYGTIELNANGGSKWTNYFPQSPSGSSAATSIAIDAANNPYVTGYSPGTNSGNDIVTIKYDSNGNQIWLQRYNGSGNGNDAGNAIAVDKNGNVYVTGYETLPGGGTGIVTIKYSPVVLQRHSDGTVILQAQGSPGESFDIQASADLRTWLDLGTVLADTNGLMQFDDTNAPNFPARFYVPKPQ
jgi:hypothetical protein